MKYSLCCFVHIISVWCYVPLISSCEVYVYSAEKYLSFQKCVSGNVMCALLTSFRLVHLPIVSVIYMACQSLKHIFPNCSVHTCCHILAMFCHKVLAILTLPRTQHLCVTYCYWFHLMAYNTLYPYSSSSTPTTSLLSLV